MDLEAQPPSTLTSSEGEPPLVGELVPVKRRPGRPRKYGQPDDKPGRYNKLNVTDPTVASRNRKALIKAQSERVKPWGPILQNRAEFVRRMHRYMQTDNWKQFQRGMKALMDKFAEGDQWAMEFVKNVMDGRGDFREAMDGHGPGQVTININADDAKLL